MTKKFFAATVGGLLFLFGCAILVLAICYFFLAHIAQKIDQSDRAELLTRVQTIARTVNGDDIAALTGTASDLNSAAYIRTKQMLYDLHGINSSTRFIYFMRANTPNSNGKLVFLVDSEDPTSKDYSPPGQVYQDTSALEMENYVNANSFSEGPYTDAWGTWISGYAPVWARGNLVGIIGMDISASKWQSKDYSFQLGLLIISIFAALGFVFIGFYIRRVPLCSGQHKA